MPNYNSDNDREEVVRERRRSSMRRRDLVPRRDPDEAVEEIFIQRRKSSVDDYRPRSRSPAYVHDYRRGVDPNVSPDRFERRHSTYVEEERVRHQDREHDAVSPRTVTRRRSTRERLGVIPYADDRMEMEHHRRASSTSRSSRSSSRKGSQDSMTDYDSDMYDSEAERRKERKARNRKFLYGGLATATTIAAANNIYQSTKQHEQRVKELSQGKMTLEQADKAKNKAILLDLVSVGVAAVCVNNARKGWMSAHARAKEHEKAQLKHDEKQVERMQEFRDQKLLTGAGPDAHRLSSVPDIAFNGITWNGRETVHAR